MWTCHHKQACAPHNRATGGNEIPPPEARAYASFVRLPNAENMPPVTDGSEAQTGGQSLPTRARLWAGLVFTTETGVIHGHPHNEWRLCDRNHPHCGCDGCNAVEVLSTLRTQGLVNTRTAATAAKDSRTAGPRKAKNYDA